MRSIRTRAPLLCALLAALGMSACGGGGNSDELKAPSETVVRDPKPATPDDVPFDAPTLLAAGDIAQCTSEGDEQTARLARKLPKATIAALGDLAYPQGRPQDYARCWDPTWGKLGNRVHPVPGNHEYGTGNADAYFRYFGPRAGEAGKGWYSYDVGDWHIIALNSNCSFLPGGGCEPGSEQERWLRADLKAHKDARCTLAYWHHARRSSGLHGDDKSTELLRQALIEGKADVLLQGHDHDYERFAPRQGLREWVVGLGGAERYPIAGGEQGSEVRWSGGFGLLALTLRPTSYEWRFLPAGDAQFADEGRGNCR